MNRALVLSLTLTLTLMARDCHGYSAGAPPDRCTDMLPNHGVSAQTIAANFTITATKSNYTANDVIDVTIASTDNTSFNGLLLVARGADTTPQGVFTANDIKTQTLNCGGFSNKTAVTHKSALSYKNVTVRWTAPAQSVGTIKFRATIVRVKAQFWVGVESAGIPSADGQGYNGGNSHTCASSYMLLLVCAAVMCVKNVFF